MKAQPTVIQGKIHLQDFDSGYCGGLDKEKTKLKTAEYGQRIGELQTALRNQPPAVVAADLAAHAAHVEALRAQVQAAEQKAAGMLATAPTVDADALIALLKELDYLGDPSLGKMWDRSLVYVATDFGRSKDRPKNAQTFGSGHDLSNGNVLLSPMLKGNRVYGGVDPKTAKTYGWGREDGAPDSSTVMREGDVYSLVCHAMDIDFAGRKDMPGLVKDA